MKKTVTVAVSAGLLVTACSFDPSSVPVPGAEVAGPTYQVHIELANALNLPAKAKVVANGAQVGTLRTVRVIDPTAGAPGRVDAVVDISASVRLPDTTTVQLRQNTILGDIFIGLTTPTTGSAKTIAPGGVIPLTQTKPALQVEDLLAGLSTFIGGGAVQQAQNIINRVNATLPAQPADTAHVFDVLGKDAIDVSANTDAADRFLQAIKEDLKAVLDNPVELGTLLSPRGAVEIPADANSLVLTLGVVGGLGVIGHAVAWLGPLLERADAAARALVPILLADHPLNLDAPSNLNRVVTLLREKIIPFAERGPKINVTGVQDVGGAGADQQVSGIINVLRMIGVVR